MSQIIQPILMVSAMASAEACAADLSRQLAIPVELAATRKTALAALRRCEFQIVIVDDCLAEADPIGADQVWKHSGLAAPLQVNFAISSGSRLVRDVRAAMARRAQEHAVALRAAASTLESELKSTVTGLLLQSQLALTEPTLTPKLTDRLKMMNELAGALRDRLERPQA